MPRFKMVAQARSAFSSKYTRNYCSHNVPSSTTLTHEGIINENYYKLKQRETKLISNFEMSHASIKNPITQKREYFLGILCKSKYDGVGIREPIDIGIVLDISGSMDSCMNTKGETRLDISKKSLITFINNLDEKDNISISAFNNKSINITSFTNAKKFLEKEGNIDIINKLTSNGGTDIYQGLNAVYQDLKKNEKKSNKHRRIILITDMEYFHDQEFIDLCKEMSDNNIYLTILGISESFNTNLTELISKMKGCNYYIILNEADMKKYLIDEFNYICFPLSFNEKLEIISPFLKIKSIIGTGYKQLTEKKEDLEWNTDTHKLFDKEFKQNIFFLLLYFKRKGKILPKPVILCISQFIKKMHTKTISQINTTFPSALTKYENNYYVKGGMILIKLEENYLNENNICQISINGEDYNNKKYYKDLVYNFEKKTDDFFSDENIEVTLGMYYFTKLNRKIMKICNEEYDIEQKNNLDFMLDKRFNILKNDVTNFFKSHYDKYSINKNMDKYLKNMDEICKNATDYAKEKKDESKNNDIELDEDKEKEKEKEKEKKVYNKSKKNKGGKKKGAVRKILGKKRKNK